MKASGQNVPRICQLSLRLYFIFSLLLFFFKINPILGKAINMLTAKIFLLDFVLAVVVNDVFSGKTGKLEYDPNLEEWWPRYNTGKRENKLTENDPNLEEWWPRYNTGKRENKLIENDPNLEEWWPRYNTGKRGNKLAESDPNLEEWWPRYNTGKREVKLAQNDPVPGDWWIDITRKRGN